MGILSDFDEREAAARPAVAPFQDTVGGSLRKGWAAGLKGAESQIRSLAGAAGEAMGADEFAANRNAEAAKLREEAAAIGPTVNHSSQVTGLRSGLNYAAGLVGSSAPVSLAAMGAAAMGGGALVPGMLRAAAFTAPFEMGDVAQKIQADPQAMQRGAGERFGDAVVGGGVSAIAQGVVPGLIGAKLMGAGARAAAGQSFKQVVGKNLVGGVAMEGVAEGGGDAIKQYAANQERPLDWESIKENAIGGAVAGGAMGTIGAGADLAARTAPQALDALGRARTSINERVQAARTAAGDVPGQVGGLAADGAAAGRAGIDKAADMVRSGAATVKREFDAAAASETGQAIKGKLNDVANSTAGKKIKSVYDRATDLYERNRTQTDADIADKIIRGEDLDIDPAMVATASDEQIAEMVRKSDGRKVEIASRMAKEMLSKLKPGSPMYEKVSEAAKNVANEGGAAAVAALKKTADAAEAVGSRMKDALKSMDERYPAAGKAVRRAADAVQTERARRRAETSASSGQFSEEDTFDVGGSPVDDRTFDAQGTFVDEDGAGVFADEDGQDRPRLLGPKGQEGSAEPTGLAAIKAARQEFIDAAKANGGTEEDGRTAFKEAQAGGMRPTPAEARAYVANKYGKKSLDDSGTQAAIKRALLESGIGTRRKEFFEVEENINNLGKLLRRSVEQMVDGQADQETYDTLVALLGPDAEPLLNSIKRTLYEDLDPGEADNYFRGLDQLAKVERQDTDLTDKLSQLMDSQFYNMPEHRRRELTDVLIAHAQSNTAAPADMRNMSDQALRTGEAQRLADSRMIDRLYQQHFGDKSDAAYAAIEQHVKSLYRQAKDPLSTAPFETDEDGNVVEGDDTEVMTAEVESMTGGQPVFDEEGERVEEAPTDVQQWGLSSPDKAGDRKLQRNGLPYSESDPKSMSYAKQHLSDLKGKFPKMDVRMEDGYIIAEERDNPFVFSEADLEDMSLDTKNHSRSESRIDIQGTKVGSDGTPKPHNWIIDSVKVAKVFRKKSLSDFEDASPKTRMQKTIEAFKQGFAQLEEQFGVQRADPPVRGATPAERKANRAATDAAYADSVMAKYDKVIIGYIGDKPVTWGKARKMSFRTKADEKRDARAKELQAMRDDYAAAMDAGDTEMMDVVLAAAQKHIATDDAKKSQELVGDSKSLTDYGAGNIGPRSNDTGKIDDRIKSDGEYGTNPFAQSEGEQTMRAAVLAVERAEAKAAKAGKELSASQRRFIANKAIAAQTDKKADVINDGGGRFRPITVDEDGNESGGELNREGMRDLLSGAADGGIDVRKQNQRGRDWRTDRADRMGARVKGFGPRTDIGDDGQLLMPFGDTPSKGGALAGSAGLGQQRRNLDEARDSEGRGMREEDTGATDPSDFYTDEQLKFVGGSRERSGRSATINERKRAREVRERIDPAAGEGRRKVGKDENISLAAAAMSAEELITRSNMDGSRHWVSDRALPRHPALTILAGNWANDPDTRAIGRRLQTLLANIYSYSEADRNKLLSILPDTSLQARQKGKMDSKVNYSDKGSAWATLHQELPTMSQAQRGVELRRRERMLEEDAQAWQDSDGRKGKYARDFVELVADEIAAIKEFVGEKDISPQDAAPIINEIAQKYKGAIVPPGAKSQSTFVDGATDRLKGKAAPVQYPKNPVQFKNGKAVPSTINSRVAAAKQTTQAAQEGTPDPKAVAAKKAAFLKRAASGDKALIEELRSSNDAKGLQRAMETLTAHNFDGVGEGDAAANNALDVLDAINDRVAELVQDPDVAYGLQTRKYSLMATAVHESLGRPGFAATHDSPIRHEGVFDWERNSGRGEGGLTDGIAEDIADGTARLAGAGTYLSSSEGTHIGYKKQFTARVKKAAESGKAGYRGDKSPTYEVSVDIKPEQLMDWDAPLSEQSDVVQKALKDALAGARFQPIAEGVSKINNALYDDGADRYGDPMETGMVMGDKVSLVTSKQFSGGVVVRARVHESKFMDGFKGEFTSREDAVAAIDAHLDRRRVANIMANAQRASELYYLLTRTLGSEAKASIKLRSLGVLGNVHNAQGGTESKYRNFVIYDDSKITTNYVHFSKEKTDPNTTNKTGGAPEVKAYIERVLGPGVKLAWAKMTHAGDFTRMKTHDLIRISVHALDPMSVAYHESLHGFFAKLRDAGATDIIGVLEKAAASPQVMAQLQERFKDQPAVLEQLKDPEERAAYMYQMWANDPTTFKITIKERTVFRRIAAFIRKLLGMWSNDERALHIMEYFHDGSYAQNMASPHAVRGALMAPGHNRAAEALQKMVVPMANLADAVVGTGSGRLRDTDIPSLIRLADLIKRPGTQEGGDQGFIAAARIEATKRRSDVGMIFENFSEAELQEAMEALQSGKSAPSAGGQAAADAVKQFLRVMRNYMKQAGTDIGDLGPDYFPRVWDAHYISKNQQAFKDMLEPYIRSGEMQGSAEQLIRNLTSRDGNEFGIETHVPGMQNKKSRVLSFIKPGDAAQFLKKDLASTLNDYLTQATRRAEWDRRLGWDAKAGQTKLNTLLIDAKSEGATDAQLEMTREYLKGIDGTLGDTINPDVRRVMGNMIVYQNVRLLPLAIFSMAVDPMGQMVRGGTLAQSYATLVRGIKSIPESWGGKVRTDEATELAELVGVVDSAIMNTVMGDIYTQGMVGGTARMINDKFFKLNLVEGMSRAFRIGASQAAMSFMKKHADPLTSKHSARWMAELGIQGGDIQMTPDGKRIALTQAEGLSEAQEQRVHAAINQWVDGAMLRPDAADKPIWMNDPRFALISHLKQFVFAFQKTILARIAHEMKHGNYSPMMVLASYVPIMMAVDTTKGLLQSGGEVPEWKKGWGPAEYTGYAMERAGLFGVGQFGLDMAQESEYGGFAPIGVSGPTIEQFTDVIQVLGGDKSFGSVLLNSMPANALYRNILDQDVEANSGATLPN